MVRRDPVAADGWSPSAVQLDRNAFRQRATRRSVVLALVSSVAVLAALGYAVASSPGWPAFRETFLNWDKAVDSLPAVLRGLWLNIPVLLWRSLTATHIEEEEE